MIANYPINEDVSPKQFYNISDHHNILIIGGGQSSAHLALLSLANSANHVTLVTRDILAVQRFDVILDWAGRYRINFYNNFRQLEMKLRPQFIKKFRKKGSVTPEIWKEIQDHVKEKKMQVIDQVEIVDVTWHGNMDDTGYWKVDMSDGNFGKFHQIWICTGMRNDITEDPLFKTMHKEFPISHLNGIPVLTEHLEWAHDSHVFIMGAYAMLQIGPDALNLAGSRSGSCRIVDKLIIG